jgi:hypothetical protein
MAKLSYPSYTMPIVYPNTTSNDAFVTEEGQVQQAQQLRVLLSVARMRRRSQRQLLVQIEQEQLQQLNWRDRTVHRFPCSIIDSTLAISRSFSGIIMEEVEEEEEENEVCCLNGKGLSSSSSLSSDTDSS